MKKLKSVITIVFFIQFASAQIDMLNDGLQTCLHEEDYNFIDDLFKELEVYSFETLGVLGNDYQELANSFCQTNAQEKFIISDSSKLSNLIKEGIKKEFWTFQKYEPTNKHVVEGEIIEIIPPGQSEFIPPSPETIEQSYINPNHPYIGCSKDYTFQKAINVVLTDYNIYKVAPSRVKLCSITEFIGDKDYELSSVKHYMLIHCICQKIIHENNYYTYFK